jgi:hypothetical protein
MQALGLGHFCDAFWTSELLGLQRVQLIFFVVDGEAVAVEPPAAVVALYHGAALRVIRPPARAEHLVLLDVLHAARRE